MDLIFEAAADADVEMRMTEAVRTWLADAEAAGLGDRDYPALIGRILGE